MYQWTGVEQPSTELNLFNQDLNDQKVLQIPNLFRDLKNALLDSRTTSELGFKLILHRRDISPSRRYYSLF